MAKAYVNFFADLDSGGYDAGAQAFEGRANQAHQAEADVGADAANATTIALSDGTDYAEIKVTSGNIFACILPTGSNGTARTAARVRYDVGDRIVLARGDLKSSAASLYLWAA